MEDSVELREGMKWDKEADYWADTAHTCWDEWHKGRGDGWVGAAIHAGKVSWACRQRANDYLRIAAKYE